MERRRFLAALGGAAGLAATGGLGYGIRGASGSAAAGSGGGVALGPRPNMSLPAGTDLIPEIDHIVMVMMENHSFDNILGVLGRGDGLTLDAKGRPTNSNPRPTGGKLRAFHMPTPCQGGSPSQDWNASHIQLDGGKCDGFVKSASGDVAMGYWTPADMPFTNSLASVFPLADRWFSSVLAQTLPNRRYLLGGTSLGLVDDQLLTPLPKNGTILDQFHNHGISWKNYYENLPSIFSWYGLVKKSWATANISSISNFFADAKAGTLPSFSMVDPNFSHSSEENPQDIEFGDIFLFHVVHAVMDSPKWHKTLLIWNYDEHGGYYDHVPPPTAHEPDDVPPMLPAGSQPGRFNQLGFRVPAGLVSPYARKDHVSHTVYDHTSVLKLCEQKWNLPALTRRDLHANSPLDMVDFNAPPAFLKPPKLHTAAAPALRSSCLVTGIGHIP
jgi:phospholipase C